MPGVPEVSPEPIQTLDEAGPFDENQITVEQPAPQQNENDGVGVQPTAEQPEQAQIVPDLVAPQENENEEIEVGQLDQAQMAPGRDALQQAENEQVEMQAIPEPQELLEQGQHENPPANAEGPEPPTSVSLDSVTEKTVSQEAAVQRSENAEAKAQTLQEGKPETPENTTDDAGKTSEASALVAIKVEDGSDTLLDNSVLSLDATVKPEIESDDEDEDLFVRQPGEIRADDTVIDLTKETETESAARAARVAKIPWVLGNREIREYQIKQEDDEKAMLLISDDEPDIPDDPEEVIDRVQMLRFEQNTLERCKNRRMLQSSERERLVKLENEVRKLEDWLDSRVQQATSDPTATDNDMVRVDSTASDIPAMSPAKTPSREFSASTGRKRVRSPRSEDGQARKKAKGPRLATRGKNSDAVYARKQTRLAQPDESARKKVTCAPKAATQRRQRKPAEDPTKLILDKLRNPNAIAAGQEMADLPVLADFIATTVKAQKQEFRERSNNNPNVDERQMKGDICMVTKARAAFAKKYKTSGDKFEIRGLKTLLFAYQFAGAGWMIRREKSPEEPHGGILADSMGLGKTVQTLACIVRNPPSPDDTADGLRTTLVVAPANAVGQWIEEVLRHCSGMTAAHYKRSDAISQALRDFSPIWVTSYDEVSMQFPSDNRIRALEGDETLTPKACESLRSKHLGPLYGMKFHRVVLDEAHSMKNHRSQRAKACSQLISKYRWALTGTPIHNQTEDIPLYELSEGPAFNNSEGILRILSSASRGSEEISKTRTQTRWLVDMALMVTQHENAAALALLLDQVMLKRSQNTKFLDHALFELPRPHQLPAIMVDLSREETLIYRRVEDKFRKKVSAELRRTGGCAEGKQVKNWLVYALRLRQAASHPYLLEGVMKRHFDLADMEWLISELSRIQTSTPFVHQVGRWCEEQLQIQQARPGSTEVGDNNLDSQFDFIRPLKRVKHSSRKDVNDLCRRCGSVPEDPFQPECGHAYCMDCAGSLAAQETPNGGRHGCRSCNRLMASIRASLPTAMAPQDALPARGSLRRRGFRGAGLTTRRRGDDVNGIQPQGPSESRFLAENDRDCSAALTPSAKTHILTSMILDWSKRYPDDKIIVFTSFILIGRIVGRMLQDADIDFLYYFGSMSMGERHEAIRDFHDKKDIRVLVASIQCTGQALNLACANRVVILDVWWNAAMEEQAYGRIYRMGQRKETYFGRIMVRNTIDERMVELQVQKLKTIETTIKDHNSANETLSAEEIASLLGRVVRDDTGKVIDIEPDYDDEPEEELAERRWLGTDGSDSDRDDLAGEDVTD